ncbi:MAG: phenylacetate--CoA ligase family protein [Proteobacteria bacterium]|nr:phenylacetate--CoA ligase family protein [Pseudomonadota bacterium]
MVNTTHDDRFAALRAVQCVAYQQATAIRGIFDRAGLKPEDLRSVRDLSSLPVTSKDELLSLQRRDPPFGGFLAGDGLSMSRIFVSPGPIYEPQFAHDRDGLGFSRVFQQAGVGAGDRVLNTWSYHQVPAGLLLEAGLLACGATVIPSGPGGTEQQARLVLELGVTCVCASTSFFMALVAALEEQGHQLPSAWRVKTALLGGEMGDWMAKRRSLEDQYKIRTVSAYATGDFGVIGYEESGVDGYVIQPQRMVQICDPQSGAPLPLGQAGEIVVTTLERGWPLIRFGTGDVAVGLAETSDGMVGRISQLCGRVGQGVKVREIFVYPRNIEEVLARVPAIERAQVVVGTTDHKDVVLVRGVLRRGHPPESAANELRDRFKQVTRVKVDAIDWVDASDLLPEAAVLVNNKQS